MCGFRSVVVTTFAWHEEDPGFDAGRKPVPSWTSLTAQLVKNPPAVQETQFDSWVGQEDPLEKG